MTFSRNKVLLLHTFSPFSNTYNLFHLFSISSNISILLNFLHFKTKLPLLIWTKKTVHKFLPWLWTYFCYSEPKLICPNPIIYNFMQGVHEASQFFFFQNNTGSKSDTTLLHSKPSNSVNLGTIKALFWGMVSQNFCIISKIALFEVASWCKDLKYQLIITRNFLSQSKKMPLLKRS